MIYIDSFTFADPNREELFIDSIKLKCYTSFYPFKHMSRKGFNRIDFEPITILFGSNGCGKTTALNIIAQTLGLKRESLFNQSSFYKDYIALCDYSWEEPLPEPSRIITSDDVFDHVMQQRAFNAGVDEERDALLEQYLDAKYTPFQMKSLSDYDQLKRANRAKTKTQSTFVNQQVMENQRIFSNGESAFRYFSEHMEQSGLYLLDEPENSLSPERQIELAALLEDLVRYERCQLVIATHSPFLLAMKGAKVYDLDAYPVDVKRWTDLKPVRTYFDFFKRHLSDF